MQLSSDRCLNPEAGEEGMRDQGAASSKKPYRRDTVKLPVTATDAEDQGEQQKLFLLR